MHGKSIAWSLDPSETCCPAKPLPFPPHPILPSAPSCRASEMDGSREEVEQSPFHDFGFQAVHIPYTALTALMTPASRTTHPGQLCAAFEISGFGAITDGCFLRRPNGSKQLPFSVSGIQCLGSLLVHGIWVHQPVLRVPGASAKNPGSPIQLPKI